MYRAMFQVLVSLISFFLFGLCVQQDESEGFKYNYFVQLGPERNNSCSVLKDCDKCIQKPDCSWCMDTNRTEPRCDLKEWHQSLSDNGIPNCLRQEDPDNIIQLLEDRPLTTDSVNGEDKFVQITPQRVKMKLRIGQKTKMTFKVAQAKQYPVDLYYLMDLSNSMSDDKANIVKLGEKLGSAIQAITNDFRIGFGSFVDKQVLPFISLVKGKNCQQDSCPEPYSFQHQMSLDSNVTMFQQRVEDAPISGNIDNPEGGFDGLVQVLVCGDRIGWRKEARRVVIFTTDQSFHIALDGKLGGIVVPNDGKCHLDGKGFYTASKNIDYPSIGQVNFLANKYRTNVIWAVTSDKIDLYRSLTGLVEGSTAGVISADSSNIVELVKKQYEAITTSIKVQSNSSSTCPSQITSKCKGKGAECKNVELGTPVEFDLSVTLKKCEKETFAVSPVGMIDKMIVEVEPICECPCKENDEEALEEEERCGFEECNGHGHLVCGECQCCGDFYGPTCNCPLYSSIDLLNPDATCRPANSTSQLIPVCSGRGECVCGECQCIEPPWPGVVISGEYCDQVCDNTACEVNNGRLCSGHGTCVCGECVCNPSYTGSDCGCKQDQSKCRSPESPDLICSNRGECPCDRCFCTADWYSGEFCEVCETCQSVCLELKPCVECFAFNEAIENLEEGQEYQNCSDVCSFEYTERFVGDIPFEWENCTLKHGNCDYTFSYSDVPKPTFGPKYVILHLTEDERKEVCPPPPDYFGIFFGVIGAIVCLGLLTLFLWKAFTTIHDRREFAKFEAERQKMRFPSHSNPIFKQATTTVQNPIFNSPHHF